MEDSGDDMGGESDEGGQYGNTSLSSRRCDGASLMYPPCPEEVELDNAGYCDSTGCTMVFCEDCMPFLHACSKCESRYCDKCVDNSIDDRRRAVDESTPRNVDDDHCTRSSCDGRVIFKVCFSNPINLFDKHGKE